MFQDYGEEIFEKGLKFHTAILLLKGVKKEYTRYFE